MSDKDTFSLVHLHDSTTSHFDFRLQTDDVMPSWAILKGYTLDSSLKSIAIKATNHSMEYRNFEGVLSEGEYGQDR